jgi:hypothetical protein
MVLGMCLPASADLVVSVGDLVLAPGGTGALDVTIRSDAPGGDLVGGVGFQFLITTTGPTRLSFAAVQPDSQLTDPDYIFYGDSLAHDTMSPVGTVSGTNVPGDTFTGLDFTTDGADVTLTGSRLLARLAVTAATAFPPVSGNLFTVSLVPLANASPSLSDQTLFTDTALTHLIPYTSQSGTVTISAVSAPEPSGLVLAASLLPCLAGFGLVRAIRRRRANSFPTHGRRP